MTEPHRGRDARDQKRALMLMDEALELWQSGRTEEAEARHREALGLAEPGHHRTPDIHAQYASFLSSQRRLSEAGPHYERALQLELQRDSDEASSALSLARHSL